MSKVKRFFKLIHWTKWDTVAVIVQIIVSATASVYVTLKLFS